MSWASLSPPLRTGKGVTVGQEKKKKGPPILRKFLVPVASRKHCWEDNVTEAALHPIISVTGREEILEHVLILTLPGGGGGGCNTPTRWCKMTFHFYPARARVRRSEIRWISVLGAASGVGACASTPLSGADVPSALAQRRHTPVSLCGDDISALTFITVRFSGECARSFRGQTAV